MGIFDDKYELSVNLRFFLSFLILFLIFIFNSDLLLKFLKINNENIYLNTFFSYFISFLLILGFLHVMNMSDGRDGNYTIYIILLFCVIFINKYNGINFLDFELLILIISLIFILILNFIKFSFFGNNGVYALSIYVGLLMFDYYNISLISTKNIYAITCIPFIDSFYVTIKRLKRGVSPFKSDLTHLHHLAKKWYLAILIKIVFIMIMIYFSYIIRIEFLLFISLFIYFFLRIFFKRI